MESSVSLDPSPRTTVSELTHNVVIRRSYLGRPTGQKQSRPSRARVENENLLILLLSENPNYTTGQSESTCHASQEQKENHNKLLFWCELEALVWHPVRICFFVLLRNATQQQASLLLFIQPSRKLSDHIILSRKHQFRKSIIINPIHVVMAEFLKVWIIIQTFPLLHLTYSHKFKV